LDLTVPTKMYLYVMASEWVDFLRVTMKPTTGLAVPKIAIFLSFLHKLELEREVPYSIARAFLQFYVIVFILQFIFLQQNAGWILFGLSFYDAFFSLS
jgi:putative ABC transport system permease protein